MIKKRIKMILLFIIFVIILAISYKPIKSGYKRLQKWQELDEERLGGEFLPIEMETNSDFPRTTVNYSRTDFDDTSSLITFDEMNATELVKYNIKKTQKLKVDTTFSSGSIILKVTQGDLYKTEIQSYTLNSNDTKEFSLSDWEDGVLHFWFVATYAQNGSINVKLID